MATRRSGSSDNEETAGRGAASKSRGASDSAARKTGGAGAKAVGASGGGGGAKTAAAKGGGAGKTARKTATGGASRSARKTGGRDLRSDLRDFASGRPEGWNHEDWMAFLQDLQERGHNIADREAIGRALERERLDLKLEGVGGLGPQKRKALADRYGTVWSLRNAELDDIASVAKVNRSVAEDIRRALH